METVNIIGINAGPREGNTAILVKEALKAAEQVPSVQVEYLSMHEYKVTPCIACRQCYGDVKGLKPDAETFCPRFGKKDDGDIFVRKFLDCDGAIIGSATHGFDVTAECIALLDRIALPGDEHCITPWMGKNRFKVIGAASTSFCSHGGAEHVVAHILRWATGLGMLPVGAAMTTEPDHNPTSSHFGAIGAVNNALEWWAPDAITPEKSRVKPPSTAVQALRAARCLGRNVSSVALLVKNGISALEKDGYSLPKVSFPKRWPKSQINKGSYMEYLVEQGIVTPVDA